MEIWAIERQAWLRKYIRLDNGIPSEQTLERVFEMINPKQVEVIFEAARREGEEESRYDVYRTTEKGHGRIEKRIYRYAAGIDGLEPRKEWEKLGGIGMVTRVVEEGGQKRTEDARN